MAETKIYIPDQLDAFMRERAMKRFGYAKGSISKAAEEAITQWLMRESLIEETLGKIVERARADKRVVAVLLFGSYARKDPTYRDVDVALMLKERTASQSEVLPYAKLAGSLFELSIFGSLPIDIQSRALDDSVMLLINDKKRFYDISVKVAREWNDTKPRLNLARNR